ncbi:MFS transporter [Aspergillus lucknowensis]|uniref:MFS transporter n=1 Tax=Aspergillus lucknowensis TaxID=176173 RepID=A0ABR4M788_9EURO
MQPAHTDRAPWLLRFRSSTVFIIATVWISSFTDYFLYAMVVPILPTALSERAGVPYKDREYWVSVLLMCEAAAAFVCCPLFGYVVDVAPTRRLPYVLGLIFLGASMGLLAAAQSTAMFVIARLLQGGATAMVAVAGLALLTDSVPLDNLGQTIGYQGSAIALGFLLGPLLGGIVYDTSGYQAVFGMAFALVGADLIMRIAVVEKKVAARWIDDTSSSDPSSLISDHLNGGYQTFADAELPDNEPEPEPATEYGNGDGPERDQPMFLQIAKQPRVVISSFGLLVQGLLFSAFDATIPIFVETHFNWTPLGAGLAFLPSALTALFEPFFGHISDKHGARSVTFTSFILLPIPLASLSFISSNKAGHIALLLILFTIIGLLMNLATPALYVETQNILDAMQQSCSPRLPSSLTDQAQIQSPDQPQKSANGKKSSGNGNRDSGSGSGGGGGGNGVAQAFGIQTMAQFLGMFLGSLWGGFVEWRFGWAVMVCSLGGLSFLTAWGMLFLGEGSHSSSFLWWRKEKGRAFGGDGQERERLLAPPSAGGEA